VPACVPPLFPRVIIEKYYQRLTQDFDTNKRICEEVAIIQSKRLRNKIAGFTTVSA
jgi:small subunit ribosomal protein S17e